MKKIAKVLISIVAATVLFAGAAEFSPQLQLKKTVQAADTYTLSNGVLTVISNDFTWEDVAREDRSQVTKIVFSGNIPTIRSDMTGHVHFHSGIWRHDGMEYAEQIEIQPGVKTIGANAFSCMMELTSVSIPNTVTQIGKGAFSGCVSLPGITIPASVTQILEGTFGYYGNNTNKSRCENLKEVSLPSTLTFIADWAFAGCDALNTINLSSTKVTTIGEKAFYNTKALKTVTLPSTIETLKASAFEEAGLTKITIPANVSVIPDAAFKNALSLESVTLPVGITSIGKEAFYQAPIGEITFPAKLGSIGEKAFANTSLQKITFMGKTPVANIHAQAFQNVNGAKGYYPAGGDLTPLKEKFSDHQNDKYGGSRYGNGTNIQWVDVSAPVTKKTNPLKTTVTKKANPLKVKVTKKIYKRSKLKKAKKFKIGASKAKGKVTYTLDKKARKAKIKVSKKGVVTIPKKCKKGIYKITVQAAGDSNYKPGKKIVKIIVK